MPGWTKPTTPVNKSQHSTLSLKIHSHITFNGGVAAMEQHDKWHLSNHNNKTKICVSYNAFIVNHFLNKRSDYVSALAWHPCALLNPANRAIQIEDFVQQFLWRDDGRKYDRFDENLNRGFKCKKKQNKQKTFSTALQKCD